MDSLVADEPGAVVCRICKRETHEPIHFDTEFGFSVYLCRGCFDAI